MSGLETIAAILGVADVAFRGISALYTAISNLHDVPQEIQSLRNEIDVLYQCLSLLAFLEFADDKTRAIVTESGLPVAVTDCAQACEDLRKHISPWLASPKQSICARIRFLVNKSEIRSVLDNIRNTKQTTILTVTVTSLVIQLQGPLSPSERTTLIVEGEAQIFEITSKMAPPTASSKKSTRRSDRVDSLSSATPRDQLIVPYLHTSQQTTANPTQQSFWLGSAAQKAYAMVKQIWHKEVDVKGQDHVVGIEQDGTDKEYHQEWQGKVTVDGKSNKVGIAAHSPTVEKGRRGHHKSRERD